ncbi:MAG: aspartate aminotransferase family protein [Clostridiales bacterium]|uniref:aspartate aminotransferase family protein n=1 Tax=Evtepia sp. TaxID=2773933 RepID=UPI0029833284|nr:aspartate aminotransferase family protein [Evtepia sp.]MDD7289236.1 aspartate aminotransferase family protein [Clostridiales bacterium]MDY4430919.1 aspartate aminotransferase family protein [Evtepia sp.]
MTFEELREMDQTYVMQTYNRFPVDIDHGKNATLYSLSGKEYIDFTSGIGVCSLGCADPRWVQAITDQAGKLGHISNLYYTQPGPKLAKALCQRTGMSCAFFGNSGAEANEAMIKLARKYSFDKYGKGRSTIITLNHSFHGRTITTLTATGQPAYHNYFFPLNEAFRYADPTWESILEQTGDDVCGIMMELIQGEGGVNPLDKELVQRVAQLCQEKDWLLLIDEVQTGVGRTGSLFAFQQYGIQPDVSTFAKGIAGGLPMGGILANETCAKVLTAGTHGSTFGANPIAAAAACTILDILDDQMMEEVKAKGQYLREGILALNSPCLGNVVGMGLMLGVDVKGERTNKELASLLAENGLLVLTAGPRLRLLPPLTITKEEMDKGLAILKQTLA